MNQPPSFRTNRKPPQWRRPPGVAAGTWEYVNQWSIADHYDEFVADTPLCRLDAEILGRVFPRSDCGRSDLILDLGCGSGRASIALADRGYDVVAVDLSTRMLQLTAEKATAASPPGRVCCFRANLVELDCLADRCAQHAICLFSTLGMIQGRQHRRRMLGEVARIVQPGGHFLLHVHNRMSALREPGGLVRLVQSWWRSCRDAEHEFGDATYAYRGLENMFMHRFSRREIVTDLRASGWQVETVWPITIDGSRVAQAATIPGGYFVLSQSIP